MMKKSKVELWSGFNLSRSLFTVPHMVDYDSYIVRKLQHLLKGKQKAVEYGAGDGIWLEYLAKNNPDREFVGVEWNERAYNYCVDVRGVGLKNLSFIQADMSEPEGVIECDLCWSFGGIEHFSTPWTVLSAWVKALSPDGLCFLTAPNLLNRRRVQNRFGFSPEQYLGKDRMVTERKIDYGYSEIWSPNYMTKFVMDSGLEVLEVGEISCLEEEKPRYIIGLRRADKL